MFDIDKVYMMAYALDENGMYENWSPLFDYSSKQALDLSEKLPIPTGVPTNFQVVKTKQVAILHENGGIDLTTYIAHNNLDLNHIDSLILATKVLDIVNENPKEIFYSTKEDKNGLMDKINEHNLHTNGQEGLKNNVVTMVHNVNTDLENQVSAYTSIDSGTGEWTSEVAKFESNDILSAHSVVSLYKIKETNSIGKDTVGVMANGLKTFFALTQYFNNYYKSTNDIKQTDNAYFEKVLNIGGSEKHVSTIGDIRLTRGQADIMNKYINDVAGTNNQYIYFNNNDLSISLSALTSLAVDNAKELALAKLNAGLELASMHIYLTILGFTPKMVAEYMTGTAVTNLVNSLKYNFFTDIKTSVDDLVVNSNNPQFIEIYRGAKELRALNSFLALNQGVKSNIYEIHGSLESMNQIIYTRESILYGSDAGNVKTKFNEYVDKAVTKIQQNKPYLNEKYIKDVLTKANSMGIIMENFNLDKYLNDANYKKSIVDYYNVLKHTINVFDCVNNLTHFYQMLSSLNSSVNLLKATSSRVRFTEDVVPKILKENKMELAKKVTIDNNPYAPLIYSKDGAKKASNLFSDYVIYEWLKSPDLDFFSINLEEVMNLTNAPKIDYYDENGRYSILNTRSTKGSVIIDTKSLDNLASFKVIMEKHLIPYLKENESGNSFVKALIKATNKYSDKEFYKININMSALNDSIVGPLYNEYLSDFNELADKNSGLTGANGTDLNWGDLFFVYNTIINKNAIGNERMSRIFEDYIKKENSLAIKLPSFFANYDNNTKTLDVKPRDVLFSLFSRRGVLMLSNGSKLEVANPNYTLNVDLNEHTGDIIVKTQLVSKIMNEITNKNDLFIVDLKCN